MKKYFHPDKKKLEKISLAAVLVVIVLLALLSPVTSQSLGNLFFGNIPTLYNVTLAQFFFKESSNPSFGNPAPFAHYQLSRTYFIQGDLADAYYEAEKELALYPDHLQTYYVLGLTYGYMNDDQKAINAFGKFIEWKPASWAARNDRAWLQFRTGDVDGALATLAPVAKATSIPWVQNTYGTLLMNKGQYAEARNAFLHAKTVADAMTNREWGIAYPGNDPRIFGTGLQAMRDSIDSNLRLVNEKLGK
jgi:tetratricopeptide (TPR) repeat protein